MYDPKYKFDELGDVAFAEIRIIMDRMKRNKEIAVDDLSCVEMAYEAKKLAFEYMERYNAACELGELLGVLPSFYGTLDTFAYQQLTVKYPHRKEADFFEINIGDTTEVKEG